LYWAKIRNKTPTLIRKKASARALGIRESVLARMKTCWGY
jgi:hypothetical protein